MRTPISVCILAMSAPALAQTTTCFRVWDGIVQCRTQQGPTLGQELGRQIFSSDDGISSSMNRHADARIRIDILVKNNRCQEAREVALHAGDRATADKVISLCPGGGEPYMAQQTAQALVVPGEPPQQQVLVVPAEPPKH